MLKKKENIYKGSPPKEIWIEMQNKCIAYWIKYFNDKHGYVTGKVNRVNGFVSQDYIFMLGMFDLINEDNCIRTMNQETRNWIYNAKKSLGLSSNIDLSIFKDDDIKGYTRYDPFDLEIPNDWKEDRRKNKI